MDLLDSNLIYLTTSFLSGLVFYLNPKYINFLFYSKKVQLFFKVVTIFIVLFLFIYGLIMIDKDINSWSIYFGCLILGYLLGIVFADKLFE